MSDAADWKRSDVDAEVVAIHKHPTRSFQRVQVLQNILSWLERSCIERESFAGCERKRGEG